MRTTKFISLLITPDISKAYVENLAQTPPTADWIMYRHRDSEYLEAFVRLFAHKLLLNLPFQNAQEICTLARDCAGVHLKSYLLDSIPQLKASDSFAHKIIGYSAHSVEEIESALAYGAHYCTLSPIFPTPNKGTPLGLGVLERMSPALRARTIALGGIKAEHIPHLKALHLKGFGAISYFRL